jgi:hypothetical protein
MDMKLKGFFDTVSQKGAENAAANAVAAQRNAAAVAARQESRKQLKDGIDAELGPILEVLKALPPVKDREFRVFIRDWHQRESDGPGCSNEPGYVVDVRYKVPENGDYEPSRDAMYYLYPGIDLYIGHDKKGRLNIESRQHAIKGDGDGRHDSVFKCTTGKTFEFARQELALGLATFATSRVGEIREKLAGDAKAAAALDAPAKPQKRPFWNRWGF